MPDSVKVGSQVNVDDPRLAPHDSFSDLMDRLMGGTLWERDYFEQDGLREMEPTGTLFLSPTFL